MNTSTKVKTSETTNNFKTVSSFDTIAADFEPDTQQDYGSNQNFLYDRLSEKHERYQNQRYIASGGEKSVYKAYDSYSCREVAMAKPIFHYFISQKEQFIKEALICSRLQHPNILPVYDLGLTDSDVPFFTMKLLEGDNLKQVISKLKLGDKEYLSKYGLNELLFIFIKVCDAIEYAHKHNVVHCDIKPENIHIDEFGSVLVADWGLAKIISPDHQYYNRDSSLIDLEVNVSRTNPKPGAVRGTPGYLAPEVIKGETSGDFTSDIYSLGVLLYELLSYRKPVCGKTSSDMFENTKNHEIMPLEVKAKWQRSTAALKRVTMKALNLDPADRYCSVEALKIEAVNFMQGFATESEKKSMFTRLRLFIHRHQMLTGVVTGFTTLLVFILVFANERINREMFDAETKEEIALQNLQMYLQVNRKAKTLSNNLSKLVQNSKYLTPESVKYRIIALGYTLNLEKDAIKRYLLLKEKAELHFIMEEFNKAYHSIKDLKDDEFKSLCKFYSEKKKDDNKLLSATLLNDLIEHNEDKDLTFKLFYLHVIRNRAASPSAMLKPVTKILNLMNNTNYTSMLLQQMKGENIVLLRNAPYSDFIIPVKSEKPFNVLTLLNPSKIDLRSSWINNLSELKGLKNLKAVNICNTQMRRESFWKNVRELRLSEIIIHKDQFSVKDIERNRSLLKITYVQ